MKGKSIRQSYGEALVELANDMSNLRVSLGYTKSNVKICATHSGIGVGEDGPTHYSISDISLTESIPNLTIVQPCDDIETKQCLAKAIRTEGTFYIRLGRKGVSQVHNINYCFDLGKADYLCKSKDVAILATGMGV